MVNFDSPANQGCSGEVHFGEGCLRDSGTTQWQLGLQAGVLQRNHAPGPDVAWQERMGTDLEINSRVLLWRGGWWISSDIMRQISQK